MQILFLMSELQMMLIELSREISRREYLEPAGLPLVENLRHKLDDALKSEGYRATPASELIGRSTRQVANIFSDAPQRTDESGMGRLIPHADIYRHMAPSLTMALNGEIKVPDNCVCRLVELDYDEEIPLLVRVLRDGGRYYGVREEDWAVQVVRSMHRFLDAVMQLHEQPAQMKKVAEYYGKLLTGKPWGLTAEDPLYRNPKIQILRVRSVRPVKKVYLKTCIVDADRVLVLGRNTWAIQQTDLYAKQPHLRELLPGVEKMLAKVKAETQRQEQSASVA